jgi:hypothetical protein
MRIRSLTMFAACRSPALQNRCTPSKEKDFPTSFGWWLAEEGDFPLIFA